MEYVFDFDREKLEEALLCVGVAIQKKGDILPQFTCVHITFNQKDSHCRVLFRSMSQSASTDYLLKDALAGEYPEEDFMMATAVEYTKLFHIVSKSTRPNIRVKWDPENKKFKVIAEGTSTLNTIIEENWLIPPNDGIEPFIEDFDSNDLIEAWKSTAFTIPQEISDYDLRGILFDGDWVTSNGRSISIFKPSSGEEMADMPRLFIAPIIENFVKLLDNASITIGKLEIRKRRDSQIVIVMHTEIGALRYMVALNSAKFPDYKHIVDIFEQQCEYHFIVPRSDVVDTLARMSIFLGIHRNIILEIVDDSLQLTALSGDTAEKTIEKILLKSSELSPGTEIQDAFRVNISYDMISKIASENKDDDIRIRYGNDRRHLLIELENKIYVVSSLVES